MGTSLIAIFLVVAASFLGAWGGLFFKKGAADLSRNIVLQLKNKWLYFGVIAYGISTIIFLFALTKGELSVIYPFVATVYIWTSILSVKFLGEKMNVWRWAGIVTIIIGVSLIGLGS